MNLLQQAEKEEHRWSVFELFETRTKYSRVAELYEQAGNLLVTEKNSQEAAKAFVKAGELYEYNREYYNSVQNYIKASKQFKEFDLKNAIIYLTKVKESYELTGKLHEAAKYLEQIGDLDSDQALNCYLKASEYYLGQNAIHSANKLRKKICEIYLNNKQYELAGNLYERVANDYVQTNSWNASEFYLNAIICFLALQDYILVDTKLKVYIDTHPKLVSDYRYKYVDHMVKACLAGNLQDFIDATFQLDEKTTLEPWKVRALLKVKEQLKEAGDNIL